jgi:hypothetical protein
MNELEERITERLTQVAGRATPTADLGRVVRDAEQQQGDRPSAGRNGDGRHWTRPVLAVAAAVVVVAAGVAAVTLTGDGGGDDVGPPSMRPPDGGTSTTDTTDTPDSAVDPPSPIDGLRLPAAAGGDLPESGFAVVSGGQISVRSADGTVVAEGAFPGGADATLGGLGVADVGDELELSAIDPPRYELAGLPDGEDCVHLAPGDSGAVETCRIDDGSAFGQELVHVAPGGERTTLAEPGDVTSGAPPPGHWAGATLSPRGDWVAAEWSGECEVPLVVLVPVDGGPLLGPSGAELAPGSDADESRFLGWDGERALIATSRGACGTADIPGVHAVDPTTGDPTTVLPLTGEVDGISTDRVVAWRRQG